MYKKQSNSKGNHKLPVAPYGSRATTLRSNMCPLKTTITSVYNYLLVIGPKIDDSLTRLKKDIVKGCSEELTKVLGKYVHSGNNIYAFKKIDGLKLVSRVIDIKLKVNYEIHLTFSKEISLKDISTFTSEQNQEIEMIFNIFLRKVLEDRRLYQIKNSRYFDFNAAREVAGTKLNSVTGYFVSVSAIKEGLYLTVDTVTEFFKRQSCLEEISCMKKKGLDEKKINHLLSRKRVSLLCAKGKTWRICGVVFNTNPINCIVQPENISLLKQWEEKYKVRVTVRDQPLLKAKRKGEAGFLIPEFCYVTGLEEESKKFGKGISDLGMIGAEPNEKDKSIIGMFEMLAKGQSLEQYGLLMAGQTKIPLQLLPKPQLTLGAGKIMTPEMLAKGVKIMNPINFHKWMFIYDEANYNMAELLFKTMRSASKSLGLDIKEPEWIQLKCINDKSVENALSEYKMNYQFILVLLTDNRKQYKYIKKLLDTKKGLISQCVCANHKKVTNITCVSNIVRQINAKLGGDLYSIELPEEIPENTMFVGIDVCHHEGKKGSVVGFYSNAYTNLARCYCDTVVQKHGQEIVSILTSLYANAFKTYLKQQGKFPDYIFIYRDGVGRNQRDQILAKELPQLKNVIGHLKKDYDPQITLIIVNKRIHQRFLLELGSRVGNPEPGTIIDTLVTENGCENFFMISAEARKGTIRPTHYYIAHNERKEVTKLIVQKLSYAMTFMYYNTPWSLKVPAQIALADKKAYYVSTIEADSNKRLTVTQSFL
jgi:hypothetical protein